MNNQPTIIVTGAGGFVARWVMREFESAGYAVRAVDRSDMGDCEGRETVVADLTDPEAVRRVVANLPANAVGIVHLAAMSHVGKSWESPIAVYEVNVAATVNLFAAAAKAMPRGRFLFVSSSEVYGKVPVENLPFDEDTETAPVTPYGVSKLLAERCLLALAAHCAMEVVIARPTNHTGPGQSPGFVVPAFARRVVALQRGEVDCITHGNLDAKRDFLDVRDVARAYREIFEQGVASQHYVVASGESRPMRWIMEKYCQLANVEPRLVPDPDLQRPVDVADVRGTSRLLHSLTGWQPAIPLETTLADVLAEARESYVAP